MAKRRTDSNRRNPVRRDLAAFLMLLLPAFMFVGLLAPAAVSVKPKAQEDLGPISFRNFAPHDAMQQLSRAIPRVFPLDSGVEPVFSGARYLAEQAREVFEPEVKTDEGGQQIVLNEDGVQNYIAKTLFDDSADETVLAVDLTPLWNPAVFDVIPGLLARGYWQWDDFHGSGVAFFTGPAPTAPVPEPAAGALLALGLGALALRRGRA
jgi:hypothetical protein